MFNLKYIKNKEIFSRCSRVCNGKRSFSTETRIVVILGNLLEFPSGTTLGKFLEHQTKKYEHKDVFRVVSQTYKWTFIDLKRHTDAAADGLVDFDYPNNTGSVLIALETSAENFTFAAGAQTIGLQYIGINPQEGVAFTPLDKVFDTLKPRTYMFNPRIIDPYALFEVLPELQDLADGFPFRCLRYPFLRHIVQTELKKYNGMHRMRDILIYSRVPSELPPLVAKVKPDQIASYHVKFENEQPTQILGYTHENVIKSASSLSNKMGLTVDDRICHLTPVYTHAGQSLVWSCIGSGSVSIIPGPSFDAEETLKIIQNEKCSILFGDSPSIKALLENPKLKKLNLSTLQKVVVDQTENSTEQVDSEVIKQGFGVQTVLNVTQKDLTKGVLVPFQARPASPFD